MADLHHNKNHDIFGGGYAAGGTELYGELANAGGARY